LHLFFHADTITWTSDAQCDAGMVTRKGRKMKSYTLEMADDVFDAYLAWDEANKTACV
jgi:hypothetical protein